MSVSNMFVLFHYLLWKAKNSILVRYRTNFFLKNVLFFKDPEDVYSRSARPSASYTY